MPHDCREPLGFRFETGTGQALQSPPTWAGCPHNVARQFRDLDLLVLEANYDPHLLETGTLPRLSQAAREPARTAICRMRPRPQAIAACGDRAPGVVWLAHLSEQNNSPKHALQTVGRHPAPTRPGPRADARPPSHRRSNLRWTSNVARERQLPLFA